MAGCEFNREIAARREASEPDLSFLSRMKRLQVPVKDFGLFAHHPAPVVGRGLEHVFGPRAAARKKHRPHEPAGIRVGSRLINEAPWRIAESVNEKNAAGADGVAGGKGLRGRIPAKFRRRVVGHELPAGIYPGSGFGRVGREGRLPQGLHAGDLRPRRRCAGGERRRERNGCENCGAAQKPAPGEQRTGGEHSFHDAEKNNGPEGFRPAPITSKSCVIQSKEGVDYIFRWQVRAITSSCCSRVRSMNFTA